VSKVNRYSSIEKHSMCLDNKGQFILYEDYRKIETRLEDLESTLRDIANINAMDYEYQEWARSTLG